MVLGEIAQHSVRSCFDPSGYDPASGKRPAIDDPATLESLLGRCNALSISRSSGIPRETVAAARRKPVPPARIVQKKVT